MSLELLTFSSEGKSFHVDRRAGELFKGDLERIPLSKQQWELLGYFLARAGELVTKDELVATIWHGRSVTDDAIARAMKSLRAALGDNSQHIIATVHGRGYRFLARVQAKVGNHNYLNLTPEKLSNKTAATDGLYSPTAAFLSGPTTGGADIVDIRQEGPWPRPYELLVSTFHRALASSFGGSDLTPVSQWEDAAYFFEIQDNESRSNGYFGKIALLDGMAFYRQSGFSMSGDFYVEEDWDASFEATDENRWNVEVMNKPTLRKYDLHLRQVVHWLLIAMEEGYAIEQVPRILSKGRER